MARPAGLKAVKPPTFGLDHILDRVPTMFRSQTVRDEGVPRLVMAPVTEYLLERVAYLGKRLEEEAASA
jgi:hypothetical protein